MKEDSFQLKGRAIIIVEDCKPQLHRKCIHVLLFKEYHTIEKGGKNCHFINLTISFTVLLITLLYDAVRQCKKVSQHLKTTQRLNINTDDKK